VESIKLIRKISDTCTEIPDSLETKEVPSLALNQIDKSKCFQCSKKVGLLGIDCRCSMTFCNLHRMPEDHSCTVDYRKLGREKLLKENKKVVASKINQI
jgi:predicted nucleic acid binding AN1-type Zn finger protein